MRLHGGKIVWHVILSSPYNHIHSHARHMHVHTHRLTATAYSMHIQKPYTYTYLQNFVCKDTHIHVHTHTHDLPHTLHCHTQEWPYTIPLPSHLDRSPRAWHMARHTHRCPPRRTRGQGAWRRLVWEDHHPLWRAWIVDGLGGFWDVEKE